MYSFQGVPNQVEKLRQFQGVGGVGGGSDKHLLEWKFQGGGVLKKKCPPWGGNEYFLELHNVQQVCFWQHGDWVFLFRDSSGARSPWRSSAFLTVDGSVKYNLFGRLTVNPIHTLLVPRALSERSPACWPTTSHELLPGRRTIWKLEKSKKSCRFTWTAEEISFWPRDD